MQLIINYYNVWTPDGLDLAADQFATIEEAKLLPEPEVSRMEYDLKDQMIRDSIVNTESKVEKLEEKVDDIKEDTRSINDTLLKMNNN